MKGRLFYLILILCVLISHISNAQGVTILGSIPVDKEIDDIALAPNTDIAYGISSEEKTLYIFDLKNYTVKKKVELSKKPNAIAVNQPNNLAFITLKESDNKGGLYVIDSEGNILKTIELPKDPQGIAISPKNNTAIITIEQDKKLQILSTNTYTVTNTITLPHGPRMVSIDTDSNRAVVVAGKAQGEGKHNIILIVDLNTGNVLYEVELEKEIKSIAVDTGKNVAVAVSDTEITLIDINTGKILSTIKTDNAEGIGINQSTHAAIIAKEKGFLLIDLNTQTTTEYTLPKKDEAETVAVDRFKNTALIAVEEQIIEIQLPNPMPKITNLVPKAARAGESGFSLTVEGEKFITTSSVQFDQNNLSTTFKDNEALEAEVPSGLITTPSTVPVTVTNPAPEGGTSEPYPFTIKYPIPVLASVTPDTIAARSPDFTVKVNGTNFYPGYAVNFNGQDSATTYINSGELNAIVSSSLIAAKGIYLIVVKTPDGQNSNYLSFTVTDPYPVITDFSPKSGQAGTVVTITGDNFNYSPTKVFFNGTQAIIQSLTENPPSPPFSKGGMGGFEIKAIVPIGASTGPITVTTTIGSTDSTEPFTVLLRNDFALNLTPQEVSIPLNGSAGAIVSLQSTGLEQFSGFTKLSVSNIPSGVTATFNPENISSSSSSILNIKLLSAIGNQPLALTVSGTANIEGSDITRTATLTLNPIPQGATTITGRIVRSKDAQPIKGVTLTIGDKTTVTDEAGNFLFIDIPVGEQTLMIDGGTANTAEATYPSRIPAPVTIIGGIDNKLPYFIYLHEVNTKTFTAIDPSKDTIIKDPKIPDFEMKIPQGVQIIGWDGLPNEKISVTLVPPDRIPIRPAPENVYATDVYMYYFFKPGGGTPTKPIPVKMPNTFNGQPGERVELWYYDESSTPDPNSNQWKTFGMGTISDDGKNIIPDPGVGIPKFCCGASRPRPSPATPAPPTGSQPSPPGGPCPIGGNSVDPYSGMELHNETDIAYPSSLISIRRNYKSDNTTIGSFGRGTVTDYAYYLQGSGSSLTYITPEAGRYILSKNPDGTYTNTQYPFLKGVKATLNGDNTRTLKFKDQSSYTFDTNGRLTRQTDINGNYVSITRDSLGNITGINDSFGKTLYITNRTITIGLTIYTVISSIMDSSGRTVSYAYDTSARLTTITNPDGGKTTYSYDGSSRLSAITNPRGIVEEKIEYDSQGRVFKQTNADGGEYLFYYFSPSTPVRVVDPPSTPSSSCTPAFVREGDTAPSNTCGIIYVNVPTSQSVPQGSTATATITQTVAIYPNKSSKSHRFNSQGYLLSMTDGTGGQTSNDLRISTNELLSITDKLGRTTSNTYDPNGNIATTTDPAGNITRYEYDLTFNKPTKITNALGNVTTMVYDPKGNLVSTTDPMGKTTTIAYNPNGQPVSITDALNNITTFDYDSKGNLVKTTDPLGNSASMGYDFIGRLIKAIDAKGNNTNYVYDLMNRITEVVDALNGKTRFTYDKNGNLTSVTDAKNQTITYTYNNRDKVASMIDQLGKIEAYSYDKMDNLLSVKDRKGQTTEYTYDLFSRLVKKAVIPAQTGIQDYITYSYDAIGRLNYIYDSNSGPISYTYSNDGCSACGSSAIDKVIQELTPFGAINYEYDALGRRTKMTVAGQPIVNYTYDAASRLTDIDAIINGTLQNFNIQYDAIGRRTTMTLPNGITTNYRYDNASKLLNLEHLNPLNSVLDKVTYTYDKNGTRTSMNRLNVTPKLPNTASNITYNSANQMITFNDNNITYDANGNMETITSTCGITNYTWDARNRLASISGFNSDCSPLTALFKYDAFGRRIEKTVNGKTIQYLYDGLDIIQEIENGTVAVNYIRTLRIDQPLARIEANGKIRYYQQDALGSVIALTDEIGTIKAQYVYDPYGNTTVIADSFDNPFQYTGRENDNTGLYFYRARYYSPELQRFISEDPIRFKAGSKLLMVPKMLNLYVFVLNNPLTLIDDMGQSPKKKKENEHGDLCLSKITSRINSGTCPDWTDCFVCCGNLLENVPDEATIICTGVCEEGLELYKKKHPEYKCK